MLEYLSLPTDVPFAHPLVRSLGASRSFRLACKARQDWMDRQRKGLVLQCEHFSL